MSYETLIVCARKHKQKNTLSNEVNGNYFQTKKSKKTQKKSNFGQHRTPFRRVVHFKLQKRFELKEVKTCVFHEEICVFHGEKGSATNFFSFWPLFEEKM